MDEHAVRIDRLEKDVQELRLDQKSILTALARIELEIARFPRCSAPNTCLTLAENITRLTAVVEEQEKRLRALESSRSEFTGGAKMFTAICTALGISIGWGLAWLKGKL